MLTEEIYMYSDARWKRQRAIIEIPERSLTILCIWTDTNNDGISKASASDAGYVHQKGDMRYLCEKLPIEDMWDDDFRHKELAERLGRDCGHRDEGYLFHRWIISCRCYAMKYRLE